jgi:hypothetical protein
MSTITSYKGHTITETNTSRDVFRRCFNRSYRATVTLYRVDGPLVDTATMSPMGWPTSVAEAKRMIKEEEAA